MTQLNLTSTLFVLLLFIFIFSSCKNLTSDNGGISESLDPVENVISIEGAENTSMTVNKTNNSYFELDFSGIQSNNIIQNGYSGEGWCIDWQKPIDSDNSIYDNIPLYSTFNVESWYPLNYFFNIVEDLKKADPELSYYDFQAVVWSLRGFPEFNLNSISDDELPSRMMTEGELNFSREKVNTILQIVEAGYEDFEFTEGTRYAVIAETPSDVQTVITVVE